MGRMISGIQARVDVQEANEGRRMSRMCIPSVERMRRKEGPVRARRYHRYIRDLVYLIIIQMNFRKILGIVTVLVDCPETDVQIGRTAYYHAITG